jgi:hypothetical protein
VTSAPVGPVAVAATGFSSTFSDNFNRSDGAVGNGWIGATSTASIASDQLLLNSGISSPWTNDLLLRPTGEVSTNQRATVTLLGSNANPLYLSLRTQTPGTAYLVGFNTPADCLSQYACITIFTVNGGTLSSSPISQTLFSSLLNTSHTYQLDVSVTGTNPTTITSIVTDLNTSTVVASSTVTDSLSVLQQNGQVGLFEFGTSEALKENR